MFLEATTKFSSCKVFVEVVNVKINPREILGKFQIARIYSREISEKNDLRKLIPAKMSSLKIGTSNEKNRQTTII